MSKPGTTLKLGPEAWLPDAWIIEEELRRERERDERQRPYLELPLPSPFAEIPPSRAPVDERAPRGVVVIQL